MTYTFKTVVNSDGSIITCPEESLKKETYLFTKKKEIVSTITVTNANDYVAKRIAGEHHTAMVTLLDLGGDPKLFEDVAIDVETSNLFIFR